MHSLGNDFVIIDTLTQSFAITSNLIKKIANRHWGIGCDQVLIITPPTSPQLDFSYRIFNADGTEVAQCGNGARCFGRYVYDHGLTGKKQLHVGTLSGKLLIDLTHPDAIQVNMGPPIFSSKAIPLDNSVLNQQSQGRYQITIGKNTRPVTLLSLGNPHCVISVPAIHEAKVQEIGHSLQTHPAFPQGVNVSFVEVLARNHIKCRVYERGVGETQACGSAACAAVISGVLQKELNPDVKVEMPGGGLSVFWTPEGDVLLKGPIARVFEGTFCLSVQETLY